MRACTSLAPGFVDLTGGFGKLPKVVKSGAKVPVTFTLTNKGNTNAKGKATVQFYASQTNSIDPAVATKVKVLSDPLNLSPNGSTTVNFNFSIIGVGTDHLIAVITFPGDKLTANNTIFAKQTITFD